MPMLIKYAIRKTPSKGLGMFADQNIKKGTCMWVWKESDHIFHRDETSLRSALTALPEDQRADYVMHCYALHAHVIVHELDDARYINHSATHHNLGCDNSIDPTEMSVFALREIRKGEEILEDYDKDGVTDFPDWFVRILAEYEVNYDTKTMMD